MEAISPRKPDHGTNKTLPSVDNDIEGHVFQELEKEVKVYDYSKRAKWLRDAVLGANDGLLSTSALMIDRSWGCPEGCQDYDPHRNSWFVAGACSMAIGEFVTVYSHYDIEVAQIRRENRAIISDEKVVMDEAKKEKFAKPFSCSCRIGLYDAI